MSPAKGHSYYNVLSQAINDITANGYDSAERVTYWMKRLRQAAEQTMTGDAQITQMMREALARIYKRMVENGQVAQFHQGVSRFTIERLRPQLRTELDKRILASADLIRLNKTAAVEKTLQRFAGWATSVPQGGTDQTNRREQSEAVRKPLARLKFEERRVLIDQGQKLIASINNVIATDGGAIALVWHSRWRQPGYDYRVDHKERDQHVYILRDSWARTQGLIKTTKDVLYYDQITAVGEEIFCKCSAVYIYALRDMPPDTLTERGRTALAEARAKIKSLGKQIAFA